MHLNTWDQVGGAGRAAFRLHQGLKRLGLQSRILAGNGSLADPDVEHLAVPRLWNKLEALLGTQYLFYPSTMQILSHPWIRAADVIQLHNTHGGYFAHTVLPWLTQERPVVWTMHDMWALTGHCAYSYDCDRWTAGCGHCPYLNEYPRLLHDTTAWLWRIKRQVYAHSQLVFVTPSAWLAGLAQASPLIGHFPVHVIPNGVDLEIWRPVTRAEARARLGLPLDRHLVLWAGDPGQDSRKGGDCLHELIGRWQAESREISVLRLGGPPDASGSPLLLDRAYIAEETELALYYGAADLTVLPSRADNLPNTILESLACGTPIVAFGVGGIPEAVRHLQTGYIAQPGNVDDLDHGIWVLLRDPGLLDICAANARDMAYREYSFGLQARRYLELYRSLVLARARNGAEGRIGIHAE